MKLNLRKKFLIIGTVTVAATVFNNLMAYNTVHKMDDLSRHIAELGTLQTDVMNADMMHDAIRADVLKMSLAAQKGSDVMHEEAMKDLKEDFVELDKSLADASKVEMSTELADMRSKVTDQFTTYKKMATDVASAGIVPAAVEPKSDIFLKFFQVLEDSQAKYSAALAVWKNEVSKQQSSTVSEGEMQMMIFAIGNVLLATFMQAFVAMAVFRPLAQMMKSMNLIAEGDTSKEIPHTKRKDEMGDMARTAQVFKENAQRVAHMAEDQKNQQKIAEEQKKKAMHDLAASFEANVKNVVDMVASAATEMDATAKSVAKIAETNQGKLGILTTQIGGTTKNVQMVASATSQLSAAVNEINQQVTRSTSITSAAVEEAHQADITVQSLTDAAHKIGEVAEMINSIAAQINLLALNATIEAARAGEAGKGFAVVASEVKSLATQTTKATEQIVQYISSIQGATGDTVSAIKNIGGKIREINEISTTIAAAVEEQSVSTQDIASNVQQAAHGTEEVSRNANDVSSSSKETGESANQMMSATSELSRQSETLRREVDKFLVGVRTA